MDVGGGNCSVFSCESGYVDFSEALLTKFKSSLCYTHVCGAVVVFAAGFLVSDSRFASWLFKSASLPHHCVN